MTITATEFKAKCLALLDRVHETGEELVISKHGKPVARLVAERPDQPWLVLRDSGRVVGDPFAPALAEREIGALQ